MSNMLPTSYQEFIHLSRYSRWLPDKNRRETWDETVGRYFDFFTEHLKEMHDFTLTESVRKELEKSAILAGEYYQLRCPIAAEAKEGPTWADVH